LVHLGKGPWSTGRWEEALGHLHHALGRGDSQASSAHSAPGTVARNQGEVAQVTPGEKDTGQRISTSHPQQAQVLYG
jgi:predicted DNA-binding protein with PD1-like motif